MKQLQLRFGRLVTATKNKDKQAVEKALKSFAQTLSNYIVDPIIAANVKAKQVKMRDSGVDPNAIFASSDVNGKISIKFNHAVLLIDESLHGKEGELESLLNKQATKAFDVSPFVSIKLLTEGKAQEPGQCLCAFELNPSLYGEYSLEDKEAVDEGKETNESENQEPAKEDDSKQHAAILDEKSIDTNKTADSSKSDEEIYKDLAAKIKNNNASAASASSAQVSTSATEAVKASASATKATTVKSSIDAGLESNKNSAQKAQASPVKASQETLDASGSSKTDKT